VCSPGGRIKCTLKTTGRQRHKRQTKKKKHKKKTPKNKSNEWLWGATRKISAGGAEGKVLGNTPGDRAGNSWGPCLGGPGPPSYGGNRKPKMGKTKSKMRGPGLGDVHLRWVGPTKKREGAEPMVILCVWGSGAGYTLSLLASQSPLKGPTAFPFRPGGSVSMQPRFGSQSWRGAKLAEKEGGAVAMTLQSTKGGMP